MGHELRNHWLEGLWVVFAAANVAAMAVFIEWTTVPFHLIWVSLTLLYACRVWRGQTTALVLGLVTLATGVTLASNVARGPEGPDELTEVPLMAAMFVACVWHARRREAALDEVRQSAAREREFVRDASHQLRTPITVARGHTELIRDAHAGGQGGRDAEVVLGELQRLSRLSDRLLMLAAAEHPDLLRKEPIDFGLLVEDTMRRWAPAARRRWRVTAAAEGSLLADRLRLELALDALIENAVKFTREDDTISLAGRAERDAVVLEVADTGAGIPPEDLPRIFDRFVRLDREFAGDGRGTGLGLATVKAVAEAHGGSVAVVSEPWRRTVFAMRLKGFSSVPAAARD